MSTGSHHDILADGTRTPGCGGKASRPRLFALSSRMALMETPSSVREVIDRGPFRDDWSSLADYRVPAWYENGKFGGQAPPGKQLQSGRGRAPVPARYRDPPVGRNIPPEPGLAGADVQNGRRVGHLRVTGL
jgi:hypothetical protein